jgi:hypothetical protein
MVEKWKAAARPTERTKQEADAAIKRFTELVDHGDQQLQTPYAPGVVNDARSP